jgi:3-hydroxyisobutyrate dehydrogenase-like beta-hydroxyacid dehydrogenase
MHTIGFIGASGLMGHGMARHLLAHGHALHITVHRNTERVADLLAAGARQADSPAALAAACDVVFLCVTGSPQVEAVVRGPQGLLAGARPGLVVVDCSTSEPDSTTALRAECAAAGVVLVDAPLARTPVEAEAGKLNVMVGAEPAVFQQIEPLLRCFAENVFHVGGPGAGHVIKLLNNFIGQAICTATAEAFAVGQRAGVDLHSTRWQRAARVLSCVTSTKAVPRSRASCSISANTASAVLRSRLPVGSSASTQAGCVTSARAMATRWRSPPDNCAGWWSSRAARPTAAEHLARSGLCAGHAVAADAQRHGHVVQRGELGQQVVELVDEAQVPVAPGALLGRAQRGEVAAHQLHAAGAGRVQPAQQVQQRALARARRAHDGQRFARRHLQATPCSTATSSAAFGEALVQAFAAQHGLTHNAAPRRG